MSRLFRDSGRTFVVDVEPDPDPPIVTPPGGVPGAPGGNNIDMHTDTGGGGGVPGSNSGGGGGKCTPGSRYSLMKGPNGKSWVVVVSWGKDCNTILSYISPVDD